eukprot:8581839-Pyramimonas_sp.AAC.1
MPSSADWWCAYFRAGECGAVSGHVPQGVFLREPPDLGGAPRVDQQRPPEPPRVGHEVRVPPSPPSLF